MSHSLPEQSLPKAPATIIVVSTEAAILGMIPLSVRAGTTCTVATDIQEQQKITATESQITVLLADPSDQAPLVSAPSLMAAMRSLFDGGSLLRVAMAIPNNK